MAQDFYAAIGVGMDDKHIATVDEEGVALAAIQGLNQKLKEQRAENANLKEQNESLEKRLDEPDQTMQSLAGKK
jgi:regulator of replication initiation timing